MNEHRLAIKTRNSTYLLEIASGAFKVTKMAEDRPNPNNINIGYIHTGHSLHLAIGEYMTIGNLSTPTVLDIIPYEQWVRENFVHTETK